MKYEGDKKPQDPEENRGDHEKMDAGEDQGQDANQGDSNKEKAMKKSEADALTGDDLQKSLDKLEEFAKSEDAPSRKEELLAKAASGDLTKSENEELFGLLGGGEAKSESTVGETVTKSLTDNEPLQKSLDVSSYLQENHDALVKSLTAVGEAIEKSDTRRHEFAMLQAKALVDIGSMVKSMSEVLETMAGQPVSGPKSAGVSGGARPLAKSFGGQSPSEDRLVKSDVLDALDGLMEESMSKGMGGRLGNGEDISVATAKFESGNQISPYALKEVKRWRQENTASH